MILPARQGSGLRVKVEAGLALLHSPLTANYTFRTNPNGAEDKNKMEYKYVQQRGKNKWSTKKEDGEQKQDGEHQTITGCLTKQKVGQYKLVMDKSTFAY